MRMLEEGRATFEGNITFTLKVIEICFVIAVCHNHTCFVLGIVTVVSCLSSTCTGERKASGYLARLGTRPLLCEVSNSDSGSGIYHQAGSKIYHHAG